MEFPQVTTDVFQAELREIELALKAQEQSFRNVVDSLKKLEQIERRHYDTFMAEVLRLKDRINDMEMLDAERKDEAPRRTDAKRLLQDLEVGDEEQ